MSGNLQVIGYTTKVTDLIVPKTQFMNTLYKTTFYAQCDMQLVSGVVLLINSGIDFDIAQFDTTLLFDIIPLYGTNTLLVQCELIRTTLDGVCCLTKEVLATEWDATQSNVSNFTICTILKGHPIFAIYTNNPVIFKEIGKE